jgi:hypothetical protein
VKAMRRYLLALSVLMASLATAQEAVDWSSLVEKVMPAVVTIVSADAKDIVQGSGFIISSDGKIVTNFHVVAGKPAILARRSDGSFLVIKGILASDKANDLAILQAEGRNLPFVPLGDSDGVKVGEAVCVIGSPMLLEGTVSAGIISAVRELQDGRKLLQITAPISKGSSGSPVFNRKGEVIGVASFILSEGQNLNFAVPSNVVKALLRRLWHHPSVPFRHRQPSPLKSALNAPIRKPSKLPRKLKTHRFVLRRSGSSPKRWRKRGKRNGLIKSSNLPSKPPRKLKTHGLVLGRLRRSPLRWRKRGNLTVPFKSPRKLKTHWIVLLRSGLSLKRWRKWGNLAAPYKHPEN